MQRVRPPRRAARSVAATTGVTVPVVLALAIGTGLGLPLLGIIRASLLRSSPYIDPVFQEGSLTADWLSGWTASRQTIPQIQDGAWRVLLQVFLALVVLLLAIALVEAFTLTLARAAVRRPEVALRTALGATQGRLVRDLLLDGARLPLLGGGLGLLIGGVTAHALHVSWPGDAPPWGNHATDFGLLGGAVGIFLLVPLLATLSPVSVAWRRDLRRFLTSGGRATATRGEAFMRNTLAVAQIGAVLVLLTSAGVLLRGFASSSEDLPTASFDPWGMLTAEVRLPDAGGLTSADRHLAYEGMLRRVAALAGVADTSIGSAGAWVGLGQSDFVHALTGSPTAPGWLKPARYHAVGPGFFRTLGVRVVHGREFGAADTAGAPRVVVVNQAFASVFRLVGNGVGRKLQFHRANLDGTWYTIVGVVEDIRAEGVGSGGEAVPKVYVSAWQHPPRSVGLVVRTAGEPMALLPAVEEAVRGSATGAELAGGMTMGAYLARFRAPLRWLAVVFGAVAAAALVLGTWGLHGVMSYNVARRTREIGIRMAVGTRRRDVSRLVFVQSLRIVGLGIVVGVIAVSGIAGLLQLLVSGVEPFDPVLFGGIAVILGSVALLASYRPARRAAAVDPQISLRAE
ncbi:FtsX-like permease family protein [Longimicrobium sp.]|uniref:FtsX-like permease family protein n=1 Tax=Longimicrobium sp. TaxID=2029185 RepID=UPI002ED7D418